MVCIKNIPRQEDIIPDDLLRKVLFFSFLHVGVQTKRVRVACHASRTNEKIRQGHSRNRCAYSYFHYIRVEVRKISFETAFKPPSYLKKPINFIKNEQSVAWKFNQLFGRLRIRIWLVRTHPYGQQVCGYTHTERTCSARYLIAWKMKKHSSK